MLNLSLKKLSQKLSDKSFSSQELTKFFLKRIKEHNKQLNAFITIDEAKSLSMAKKSR
jgi:aspartyl-tRNA(Asn)/glutamyl-tRNA(Gln) amidotransferase subunit A